jgi:hypothetical protein
MRIQLAALLALTVAATIVGTRALADSASPKPAPAMSCIGGFALTVDPPISDPYTGHLVYGHRYSCTSGHVACPPGYALIQGGDPGPKFYLQGPKPADKSVFIYRCQLNP